MEETHEYGPNLTITSGVSGDDQESSFMNATLQHAGDLGLEFSIAVHVNVPADVKDELDLHYYLRDLFAEAIHHTNSIYGRDTLSVEIQLGPAGDGEDDG